MMLVIANFSEAEQQIQVNIPIHMFELWGIKEKQDCRATNMLTGEKMKFDLCSSNPLNVAVPGWNGLVLRICV